MKLVLILWSVLQECSSQDSSLELCDMSETCADDSRLSCDSSRSRERSRRSDSRSLDVSDTSSVHSRSPSASITMVCSSQYSSLELCVMSEECADDSLLSCSSHARSTWSLYKRLRELFTCTRIAVRLISRTDSCLNYLNEIVTYKGISLYKCYIESYERINQLRAIGH